MWEQGWDNVSEEANKHIPFPRERTMSVPTRPPMQSRASLGCGMSSIVA